MLKFQLSLMKSLNFFLLTIMSLSIYLLLMMNTNEILFMEFPLMASVNINFVILLDQMSLLFIFSVSLISFSVLFFSKSYMSNDKNFNRFHFLVMTFILSMYFLILSPNMISVLLGWDGLGLSSYLLVIYYGSSKAYNSGMVTALTNRLGDAFILLSIGYLLMMGSWNFYFYYNNNFNSLFVLLIILAASTKSAQIPFSAWLPAAMAAPTPVSSLVHSSTLVTAGIYLLIRHSNLFLMNNLLFYMMIIGTFTMIMASLTALFETDLKKMVALSTLSQLGVMFLSLGLGSFLMSYFHLLTHAFFKALLFLCTGAVIHSSKDYQDLRMVGSSINCLPTINSFILLANLSLMGLPFMSAFFSKEMILEFILLKNFNIYIYVMMILGVALTAMYSSRFILLVFSMWNFNDMITYKSEEDNFVLKSVLILSIPASLSGSWLFIYLFNSLKLSTSNFYLKILVLSLILISILYMLMLQLKLIKWDSLKWSLGNMWYLPFISTQFFIYLSLFNSWKTLKIFDRGSFEFKINFLKNNITTNLTSSFKMMHNILCMLLIWMLLVYIIYSSK